MEHVQMERPDVLLVELAEDVTMEVVSALRGTAVKCAGRPLGGRDLHRICVASDAWINPDC